MPADTVWLVGMMGSGKTSCGRIVADVSGVDFVDVDEEIAARMGCSIPALWGSAGEAAFRDMEQAQVVRLAGREAVVATGGGVVLRSDNVRTMRSTGPVVWLSVSPDVAADRVGDATGRPLLLEGSPRATLGRLLEDRADLYEAASDVMIDTDGRLPAEVADEVVQWLQRSR